MSAGKAKPSEETGTKAATSLDPVDAASTAEGKEDGEKDATDEDGDETEEEGAEDEGTQDEDDGEDEEDPGDEDSDVDDATQEEDRNNRGAEGEQIREGERDVKEIEPSPTEVSEEIVTGADGLRSVVFEGTTLPYDDEPVSHLSSSVTILATSVEHTKLTTPPLDIQRPLETSTGNLEVTDSAPYLTAEVLSTDIHVQPEHVHEVQATESLGLPESGSLTEGHKGSDEERKEPEEEALDGSVRQPQASIMEPLAGNRGDSSATYNDSQLVPPDVQAQNIPDIQERSINDAYTPVDFISRRPLQSAMVDAGQEVTENQFNEMKEEAVAQEAAEGERTEPDGQEETPPTQEEQVTPTAPELEPLPPVGAEDYQVPTPPTIMEKMPEESSSGGVLGPLNSLLKMLDPVLESIINWVSSPLFLPLGPIFKSLRPYLKLNLQILIGCFFTSQLKDQTYPHSGRHKIYFQKQITNCWRIFLNSCLLVEHSRWNGTVKKMLKIAISCPSWMTI